MKKIFTLFLGVVLSLSLMAINPLNHMFTKSFVNKNISLTEIKNSSKVIAENPNGTNFNIAVDSITASSANITVTPISATNYFYFDMASLEDYVENQYTTETFTDYLKNYVADYIDYGYTYEMLSGYMLSQGEDDYMFTNLKPNTEYVVFAFTMDPTTWNATSEMDTVHFVTEAGEMSENVLTLDYVDGYVLVTTTNDDPYFFVFESETSYLSYQEDYSQQSINNEIDLWISTMVYYNRIENMIYTGDQVIDINDFSTTLFTENLSTGDYIVLVAGYNEYRNTDATYLTFYYDAETAVDNINTDVKVFKTIVNGNMIINKNGKQYDILGNEF